MFMEPKLVSESKVEISQLMMPSHANPAGNVHGGTIVKLIDEAGGIAAMRHTRQHCVTASIDKIDFISPVFVGHLVIAKASINFVGRTSMEIGVRVEAENLIAGTKKHVNSAYLTYVALGKRNKPVEIPKIIPETDEEKRRYQEAQKRKKMRLQMRMRHKR